MRCLLLLFSLILYSCSPEKDDLLKQLGFARKATQDSIDYARSNETAYKKKASEGKLVPGDSAEYTRFIDSVAKFHQAGIDLEKRINRIDFLIDSLSKPE